MSLLCGAGSTAKGPIVVQEDSPTNNWVLKYPSIPFSFLSLALTSKSTKMVQKDNVQKTVWEYLQVGKLVFCGPWDKACQTLGSRQANGHGWALGPSSRLGRSLPERKQPAGFLGRLAGATSREIGNEPRGPLSRKPEGMVSMGHSISHSLPFAPARKQDTKPEASPIPFKMGGGVKTT